MIHGVNHDHLVAFLSTLVGPDDAEDVAQETYVAALDASKPYDPDSPAQPSTWVYSIAKNQARKWLRNQKRRRYVEAEGAPQPMGELPQAWLDLRMDLSEGDRQLLDARVQAGSVTGAGRLLGWGEDKAFARWKKLVKKLRDRS